MPVDHLATIRRYYRGCSTGDAALMQSTFTDDVAHYFPTQEPVRGAAALAAHWVAVRERTGAVWTVDHGITVADEAVIEWTMRFHHPRDGDGRIRGAEWYVFRGARIAEIRAYYHPGQRVTELRGFLYDAYNTE